MHNLKTSFTKKDIQSRFNISLATVNNWIKTGVIPSPTNGRYTFLYTTEVFSITLYNSILKLSENGRLIFFLPESILNVSAHKNIRKFLLQCKRNIEILPLGISFKKVQSECILLKLSEKVQRDIQIKVKAKSEYNLDLSK